MHHKGITLGAGDRTCMKYADMKSEVALKKRTNKDSGNANLP